MIFKTTGDLSGCFRLSLMILESKSTRRQETFTHSLFRRVLSGEAEGYAVTVVATDTGHPMNVFVKAEGSSRFVFYSPGNLKSPGNIFDVKINVWNLSKTKQVL